MMRDWFTARELAFMSLDGMPKTIKGILKKSAREGWTGRKRNDIGGGFEYHISNLSAEAQIELLQKSIDPAVHAAMEQHAQSYIGLAPIDEDREVTENDRRAAKIIIVGLFNKFRATSGLNVIKAEEPFVSYYRSQRAAKNYNYVPQWVFDVIPDFSIPSLRRWRKACTDADLRQLSGRYGNRRGASLLNMAEDGRVASFIAATLVTHPQLKPGHIRDLVRGQFGALLNVIDKKTGEPVKIPLPKLRSFERHINEWKASHAQIHAKMTNPDGYKNSSQIALGSQSMKATGLNHVWEIDASPVDALCIDGRYTLYAIIDVWSRRALFMVSKTPRTEASLQMIRRAIMAWGIPQTIKTDNGSDFTSKRFQTTLVSLGIAQDVCPPYTPEGKPHVERVIKTIQHQLMPLLPGYVGHDVEERSQIQSRKTFAQNLGVDDAKAFMVSLNHAELYDKVSRWAEDKYNMAPHSSLGGLSPFAKAASWSGEVRRVNNPRALDLLLAPIAGTNGYRTITKKGITINKQHYFGPGVQLHMHERVFVRHDPEDASKVFVFSENDQFLFEAVNYEHMSADERSGLAAEAKASQKAHINKSVKELRRAAREFDLSAENLSETILNLAKEDRSNLVEMPRPSVVHETQALLGAQDALDSDVVFSKSSAPVQQTVKPLSDDDVWWERRRSIIMTQLSDEKVSELDEKWLAWYEKTPQFRSRQHLEEMKASYDDE